VIIGLISQCKERIDIVYSESQKSNHIA